MRCARVPRQSQVTRCAAHRVQVDDMGEWEEARQLYEEVIAARTVQLGPDDTATLDAQW
jgi:hypothetical protein